MPMPKLHENRNIVFESIQFQFSSQNHAVWLLRFFKDTKREDDVIKQFASYIFTGGKFFFAFSQVYCGIVEPTQNLGG